MKINSFCDTSDERNITYSYTKRGINQPYHPDRMCERFNGREFYDKENGNLFYGVEVSWKGEVLLEGAVDLNISLDGHQFVDHIYIKQSVDSRPASIDVLTKNGCKLKKIATYSEGKVVENEEITISIGYFCDNIVLRFNGAYEPVGIRKLDICSINDTDDVIFPLPENISYKTGILGFDKIAFVSVEVPEAEFAGRYLCERIKEKFDIDASISDTACVKMIHSSRNDEGFEIKVTENECVISAGCKRGFVYAVDAFVQLATDTGIRCCELTDKPMVEFRGVHIGLNGKKDLPFLKKFIREIVVPMRYNTVIICICAAMRFDNFPEINNMWLTAIENYNDGKWPRPPFYGFIGGDIYEKEELSELCDWIRQFGIEIIPEIQTFFHAQYITTAYPQLAEIPLKTDNGSFGNLYMADNNHNHFYAHNMCPLHEDYYKYVFGIADEIIETIKPERYVHMGHDEGYFLGQCEKCSKHDKAKLFADEVNKLNEYVKSKNLTMMIWSDMFHPEYRFGGVYTCPEAINYVDEDVVMLDFTWYFHTESDIEDVLLRHNFKVGYGNLYSSHFPRYDSRIRKKGIIGGQISMWVACDEDRYAYEGKMYDMLYTGNMLWSTSYNSDYRLYYNEIIKELLWNKKCAIAEIDKNVKLESIDFDGSIKNIPNLLLWNIPYEKAIAVSTDVSEAEIVIDKKTDILYITHATDKSVERVMWKPAVKIGEYEICYDDGTSAVIDVSYGLNICKDSITYGWPIESILFRHEGYIGTYSARPICGKDEQGNDYTLLECPMKNPFPEKVIKSLKLKHMKNTDARIIIYDIRVNE